ncbi:hypothetical protein [Hymenobacter roseosalivarius]|uniref:hypothetical protein n=1 Tax=Hymenobacter roseosalivarius TaxID=89967 RepID=UPI001179C266|nr:hypothetical protein [Hymenobacter roseosalivarius]
MAFHQRHPGGHHRGVSRLPGGLVAPAVPRPSGEPDPPGAQARRQLSPRATACWATARRSAGATTFFAAPP